MNAEQTYRVVQKIIDEKVSGLSPEEYLEFLELLIGDLESREETTRHEIDDAG